MQKPAFFANFTRAISAFHPRPKKSFGAAFIIFALEIQQKETLSRKLQIENG